ncbi:MAG: acyl-CoA reductase [Bacteroidetes bacterium]|nr:acyl-CoA reductase [Bacteroidota bacterium]
MELDHIIAGWTALGRYMSSDSEELERIKHLAYIKNKWLTIENIKRSMEAISGQFLTEVNLNDWLSNYQGIHTSETGKTIGVVAAGNIPLVAFHDVLCVLNSGHSLKLKLSDKADVLLPHLLDKLCEFEPAFKARISIVERLKDFDAVIATGSNNSARYFDYYFGKVPNIIRRNRNSVAVLTGEESASELKSLAHDVFDYFGLGCRNTSKLYVPKDYDFEGIKEAFTPYAPLNDHNLYRNNLDYNRTLLLLNNIPFLNIDHINITENPMVASPIANLHYEQYSDLDQVKADVALMRDQLQCVVGNVPGLCTVSFGESQSPGLMDYADDVDVQKFLAEL